MAALLDARSTVALDAGPHPRRRRPMILMVARMLTMRRRLMGIALLFAIWLSAAGLFTMNSASAQKARAHEIGNIRNQYSSDPSERMREMLNENEGFHPSSVDWHPWSNLPPGHI